MAAPFQPPQPTLVGPDTPISIKTLFEGYNRRFKLPLRELGAYSLPQKVCNWSSFSPFRLCHFVLNDNGSVLHLRVSGMS